MAKHQTTSWLAIATSIATVLFLETLPLSCSSPYSTYSTDSTGSPSSASSTGILAFSTLTTKPTQRAPHSILSVGRKAIPPADSTALLNRKRHHRQLRCARIRTLGTFTATNQEVKLPFLLGAISASADGYDENYEYDEWCIDDDEDSSRENKNDGSKASDVSNVSEFDIKKELQQKRNAGFSSETGRRKPNPSIDSSSANINGERKADRVAASNNNDEANPYDENTREYFATCIPGLQNTLASELTSLGALDVLPSGSSGVSFVGSPILGLKCVVWCRTAHRIMELIASSSSPQSQLEDDDGYSDYYSDYNYAPIRDRNDLYEFTKKSVHTPSLLGDGKGGLLTLSVKSIYTSSRVPKDLCHGHFTALTVKNALVDAVRELREDGERPDVSLEDPDCPLVVVVKGRMLETDRRRGRRGGGRGDRGGRGGRGGGGGRGDRSQEGEEDGELVADVDLYRCLHAGGSLHRRGYRKNNNMQERGEEDEFGDSDFNAEEDFAESFLDDRRPSSRFVKNGIGKPGEAPIHRAAMKETLAAGLLLEAGWDKLIEAAHKDGQGAVLIDPMTGSGTFPTEAALIACDMAPGLLRIASWRTSHDGNNAVEISNRNPHRLPPAMRWKDFCDMDSWNELLGEATKRAKLGVRWASSSSDTSISKKRNVSILCNEKNPRAFSLARNSIKNAGVSSIISMREGDCIDWDLGGENQGLFGNELEHTHDHGQNHQREVIEGRTIFVCNPPWGVRLTESIDESWVALREFLRREGHGAEVWILCGNKDLTKILRMKKSRSFAVRTAEEDLRWLQYHIFQKSKANVSGTN